MRHLDRSLEKVNVGRTSYDVLEEAFSNIQKRIYKLEEFKSLRNQV